MDGVRAKFVSKKISKIRWKPTKQKIVEQPTLIVTGSWDEEDSANSIDLWTVDQSDFDSSVNEGNSTDDIDVPIHLHSLPHNGDVTDLVFLGSERILAASSSGSVTLLQHDSSSQKLAKVYIWERLHHFPSDCLSPCTAVATCNENIFVTVGEDGRMNIVNLDSRASENVVTIANADSTTLNGACFLRQTEIATINSIGQFKIWDLRQSRTSPARILVLNPISGSPVALRCLDQHPTQPHIVATGGQNGELYIWDTRQDKAPATLLTCHQSDVWEVHFHPTHPNSLFTCSNDGSVFHWGNSLTKSDIFGQALASRSSGLISASASSTRTPTTVPKGRQRPLEESRLEQDTASWLIDEVDFRDKVVVKELFPASDMPINSLDVIGSTIICGTDGEEILYMQNLDVF